MWSFNRRSDFDIRFFSVERTDDASGVWSLLPDVRSATVLVAFVGCWVSVAERMSEGGKIIEGGGVLEGVGGHVGDYAGMVEI